MEMSKLVGIVKENAVCSITFYNDEGQVVSYLTRAIKNKYLELYRKSRKRNDKIIAVEEDYDNKI